MIGPMKLASSLFHAGLVEEGNYVFAGMLSYSVKHNLKHCTYMVGLLGRCYKQCLHYQIKLQVRLLKFPPCLYFIEMVYL